MRKRLLSIVATLLVCAAIGFGQSALQVFDQAKQDFDAKRFQSAATGFARYTQLVPTDPAGFTNLGLSYYFLDRYSESIPAFSTATRLKSDSYTAWVYLGICYEKSVKVFALLRAFGRSLHRVRPNQN